MRPALLLVSAALGSGCVCNRLQCEPTVGCMDERSAIALGRWNAEAVLLSDGWCDGPRMERGSSPA